MKILPFAATWMDLEGVVLSEISPMEKKKYCIRSLICGIYKLQQTSEYNKKETDSQLTENKLVVTSGERERRRGNIGVGD